MVQSRLPSSFGNPPKVVSSGSAAQPPAARPQAARPPARSGRPLIAAAQPPPPPPPLPQAAQEQAAGPPLSAFATGAESIAYWEEYYRRREAEHNSFLLGGYQAANHGGLQEQETSLQKEFEERLVQKDVQHQAEVGVMRETIDSLKVENARLSERAAQLSRELAVAHQLLRGPAFGMYSCNPCTMF
jgi:hypothetical protein